MSVRSNTFVRILCLYMCQIKKKDWRVCHSPSPVLLLLLLFGLFFSLEDDDVPNVFVSLVCRVSQNDDEKHTQLEKERERESFLELPLLHLFDFLLMMLMPIENGRDYMYAPTKRIELAMCIKLVIIFFSFF